jgi:hypothetical protein
VEDDAVLQSAFEQSWAAAAEQPPAGARARMASRKPAETAWQDLVQGQGYSSEVWGRAL